MSHGFLSKAEFEKYLGPYLENSRYVEATDTGITDKAPE